jgi:hypothetical protein
MKRLFLSVAALSLISISPAFAQSQASKPSSHGSAQATRTAPAKAGQSKSSAGKTHVVNAEFVSYDPAAKMVTLKDDKGATTSAPVEGRAVSEASHMKKGQKVMASCRDNASGEHQAVTSIRPAKSKT